MATALEFRIRAINEAKAVLADVGADVGAMVETARGQFADLGKSLADAQTTMRNTGAVLSVAVTAPLVLLGEKAADAASNLGESINAVNVIFGSAAGVIHEFAKVAAGEAGLSMRALNEAVTPIGAMLINAGLGANDAATASIDLAKRSADMASIFNVDVSEALAATAAGLRGESEPLRRFGVDLSDAAVRAKAVELGLADSTASVDAHGLAQARIAVLMAETDKMAGDFVNTSDQLANKERINAQVAENTAAVYGEKLLPAKQAIADAIATLLGLFGSLSPEMQTTIVVVLGLVAALGPVLIIGSQVIGLIRGIGGALAFLAANPIVLIIAAILAVVAALVWLWNNSREFRDIVTGAFNRVAAVVGPIFAALMRGVGLVGDAFGGLGIIVGKVWDGIVSGVKGAVNLVIGLINGFIRMINSVQIHIPRIGIDTPAGFIGVGPFDWNGLRLPQIPHLATGAWELADDTLAFLHRGEMVVPAGPAEAIRSAADGGFPRNAPLVNIENVNGIQPGELERQTERAVRRATLAWGLGR